MSQTFFSKQDPTEKASRLALLGNSRGVVTVWLKGKKDKHNFNVSKFDKDREEIVLDSKDNIFASGETVLCTFELRGMNFFSEVVFQVSISGYNVLQFKNTLFKSERRSSYRLMTFPLYDVSVEFDLGENYEGGNVVDMKSKSSQTALFKNFLKIVSTSENPEGDLPKDSLLKIRVQDLSTTGMSIHVGELEAKYFLKDQIFKDAIIRFTDDAIKVPEAKIMYVVDYISNDKNLKKYKVGIHFSNLPATIDDRIGKKINELLRQNDHNKDFENFIK